MDEQYILEVDKISKSFGQKLVLNELSLKAEKGAITSIVGENGSGKTTLLKIILGLLRSDAGTIRFSGQPGYCPQDMQVFGSLTLRENLIYFATAYGLGGSISDWKRNLQSLIEDFRLKEYMDISAGKLSGGTLQKLNLIIALLHDPDLLILDEPYAAFDWESYTYFWELVMRMKQQQKSFLIVSHLIYDQKNIDRIFELKDGRLV